jgi:hypothetical protein
VFNIQNDRNDHRCSNRTHLENWIIVEENHEHCENRVSDEIMEQVISLIPMFGFVDHFDP